MCRHSLPVHLIILLIAPLVSIFAAEPPPGPMYAWYREEGIQTQGAVVSAWENASPSSKRADRTLNRVVGKPQLLHVRTTSGLKSVVRLNGSAALWQAVGSWGTLRGERTIAIFARMPIEKSGTLFDGSTRVGSTPVKWKNGKWESSARNDSTTNRDGWQVHTFRFNADDKPLGGFILGANVATQEGLTCDVGEVLVYPRTLNDLEIKDVVAYLQTKWGDPKELPAELQPQAPQFFYDSRVFRTTIRKQGQDDVHTYRIPGL